MSSFSDATEFKRAVADEGKAVPDPAKRLDDLTSKLAECIDSMSSRGGSQDFGRWVLEDIMGNLDQLWDRLHEAQTISEDVEQGIAQQTEDIDGLQAQIDDLTGDKVTLEEQVKELEAQLRELNESIPEGMHRRIAGNDYPRHE